MDPTEHAIAEGYLVPEGNALTHEGLEALARLEGPFALTFTDADGITIPVTVDPATIQGGFIPFD